MKEKEIVKKAQDIVMKGVKTYHWCGYLSKNLSTFLPSDLIKIIQENVKMAFWSDDRDSFIKALKENNIENSEWEKMDILWSVEYSIHEYILRNGCIKKIT